MVYELSFHFGESRGRFVCYDCKRIQVMKIADYWASCGAQVLKKEDVKMSADENLELAKDVIHAYNEHLNTETS